MTDQQKDYIAILLGKYQHSSTDSLIGYVADTNGMLSACRILVKETDSHDASIISWLTTECEQKGVDQRSFIYEIEQIVILFESRDDRDDPYAILGLSIEATPGEIKQTYRKLSLQYHPDISSDEDPNNPDMFIRITKAYHTLLGEDKQETPAIHNPQGFHWRQEKQRSVSRKQRNRVYMWAGGFLLVLIVLSFVAAANYRKRTMLIALQDSRGAFIPPTQVIVPKLTTPYRTVQEVESQNNLLPNKELPSLTDAKVTDSKTVKGLPVVNLVIVEDIVRMEKIALAPNKQLEPALEGKEQETNLIDETADTIVQSNIVDQSVRKLLPEPLKAEIELKNDFLKEDPLITADYKSVDSKLNKQNADIKINEGQKLQTVKIDKEIIEDVQEESIPINNDSPNERNTASAVGLDQNRPKKESIITEDTKHPENIDENIIVLGDVKQSPKVLEEKQQPEEMVSVALVSKESSFLDTQLALATGNVVSGKVSREVIANTGIKITDQTEQILENNTQERIDQFIEDYLSAYHQRNIIKFTRFFEDDAVENGKPFTSMIPVYSDLFESVSDTSLDIQVLSWDENENSVMIKGRFNVYLKYNDSRELSGSGPISFTLTINDTLRIKELMYDFDG